MMTVELTVETFGKENFVWCKIKNEHNINLPKHPVCVYVQYKLC